jgi:hypothetical protein
VSTARLGSSAQSGAGDCIAHHPSISVWSTAGCSGHDEPELDPVSSAPGSAQDLTWTAILPADGTVPVSAVGPTFWRGGTVSDPNPQALFGQAFLELQFYPDAIVNNCSSAGGFNVSYAPDKFTVCSPVWQVSSKSNAETAAFNAGLYDGASSQPLVMSAGDTIRIHFFVASASDGWHVQVTDLTTGHSGTTVTFGSGANASSPSQWAVVSDFGGTAEVNQFCPSYGADYPGTKFDYGQAAQFATTTQCGGPFGPDSTYCDTILKPTPPVG